MMSMPRVPDPLPPAIARPRRQVKAVMASHFENRALLAEPPPRGSGR